MTPTPNNEALTDQELQSLRNLGNECERAADEIASLRAALASSGQAASAVPEGMRLVPVALLEDAIASIDDYRASVEFGASDRKLLGRLKAALASPTQPASAPAAPAQPREADPELPSMWEQADFTGGETDGSTPPAPRAPAQPREAIDMGEDRDIQYAVKLEREFAEIERRHGLLLRVLMDIAKDCTSRAEAVEMAKAAIEADKKGG